MLNDLEFGRRLSRTVVLRAILLLTTSAGLFGYLHELERAPTGLKPRAMLHTNKSECPTSNAAYPVTMDGKTCKLLVTVCEPLGIAFLHNYKAAGTSIRIQLEQFCLESTGVVAKVYEGYRKGEEIARPCDLDGICKSLRCYSVIRDPVERFLSAYHG
jgi:hypothetical protein